MKAESKFVGEQTEVNVFLVEWKTSEVHANDIEEIEIGDVDKAVFYVSPEKGLDIRDGA